MHSIFYLSQTAMMLGAGISFYGVFQSNIALFILGLVLLWCGSGLMTTLLEIQRSHLE